MKTRPLGRTGLKTGIFSLGTMTFGTQTSETDAHRQLDMAVEAGINLIDTAELYPVNPILAETCGDSEVIIGNWLEKSGRRGEVLIATKVAGGGAKAVRNGAPISPATITEAVEASLKRLKTDVIDLYQLHWPNRGSYHFRQNWGFNPASQNKTKALDDISAALHTLDTLVRTGKIRHIGLSNESAWGTAQFLRIAEAEGLPRVATIQNEYSLLCRHYDLDLAELSHHEDVGLLAFSPLAVGILTGKYSGDVTPEGSRRSINPLLSGRLTPQSLRATDEYTALAQAHGIDPVHMALAFCTSRPFMAAAIVGATTSAQLAHLLKGADIVLSDEVLAGIQEIYSRTPMPM
ncbi:MAG: aldo/keto reductase [Rhodobacteraceae bacterium]|nr:aldo/keto reductase [Paracoccaceae bacterium]